MTLTETQRSLLDFERAWWQLPASKTSEIRSRFGFSTSSYYPRCTPSWIVPMRRRTTRSPCGVSAGDVSRAAVSASRAAELTLGAGEARRGSDGAE